jgi:hypothetical protein
MWRTRQRQSGIVAVIVALAILSLLAMAGLAIDIGYLVLNKSRLQSTVDAAALAGAKALDLKFGQPAAEQAARAAFTENAKFFEISRPPDPEALIVEFSSTLDPFAPGSTPAHYVRARYETMSMSTSFTLLLGFRQLDTRASAVAGPSAAIPNACDLFPVAVCIVPGSAAPHWGYPTYGEDGNNVTLLKLASSASGTTFGPGNYQLIRIGGTGSADLRRNLAGGASCAKYGGMTEIDPEPGNMSGPIAQGVNTRFGLYSGPIGGADEYRPDLVVTSPASPLKSSDGTAITNSRGEPIDSIDDVDYSYKDYIADYGAKRFTNPDDGWPDRRKVTIPFVDCKDPVSGTSGTLPVKGFGCFFLLQPVEQSGGEGWMFGQFVDECTASGNPGQGGCPGPYKIVLHNDPGSEDS